MQLDALIFARDVLEMRESDVFAEALRRVDASLYADWQRTEPRDVETRERAWHIAHGVKRLVQELDVMAMPARQERNDRLKEQGVPTTLRRPTIASSTA